jgi:serine/threonine protein kinase
VAKVSAEVGSTANRYQVLGKLAAGGMAEIFLARGASATGLVRYCVLKRILRERSRDAEFVRMFLDEARLAAQLQHPNIAQVYDLGMLGDSYFFTMEYVHGETVRALLHRALSRKRSLPLACVLTVVAGAASGLHHAHDRVSSDGRPLGIVHRDVSPSNLMVSYEGNVKILDFGVAKAADRGVETRSGTVKGKISYLSPEQCRGERVDRRSDLFSLGIVMWEMLAGARLYRRASDFDNMTAIVHEAPPPPSSRRAEVPRAVDDIVLRLLAKSVADRFQTAGEVVEALEHASMRAGTILSTSALSRLIHDLFGARAEPWLELDARTLPFQRMTLASSALPGDLRAPVDPVELELAAVPDLSVSKLLDDEFDPGSSSAESAVFESPTPLPAPLRVAVQRSSPIPMPPTRRPTAPPPPPPPLRAGPGLGPAAPSMPSTPGRAPPPVSSTRALLDAIAAAIPAGPASATTLLGVSAPASAAAMATIRQNSALFASAPNPTVRDLSAAAADEATLRDPPGLPAGVPIDTPTRLSRASASMITPTQVSPWPPGNATPSAPFEAVPRFPAASAPNPVIDHPSAPHRSSQPSARFSSQPPVPHPAGFAPSPPAAAPADYAAARRRGSRFTPALISIMIAAAAIGAISAWLAMRADPRGSHPTPPVPGSTAAPTPSAAPAASAASAPDTATSPPAPAPSTAPAAPTPD